MPIRLVLLAALLLCILAPAAQAARKVALVIGSPAYVGATPIDTAVGNADAVAGKLREIGFEVTESVDADHAAMVSAIGAFNTQLTAADVGLVYFCGYAIAANGANNLVPRNFDPIEGIPAATDLFFQGVPLDDLLSSPLGLAAAKVVILDWRPVADASGASTLAPIAPREGVVVLSAAASLPLASGPVDDATLSRSLVQHLGETGTDLATLLEAVRLDVQNATQLVVTPQIVAPPSGIPSVQLYSIFDLPSGGGGPTTTPGGEVPIGSSGIGSDDTNGADIAGSPPTSETPPGSSGSGGGAATGPDCLFPEMCPNTIPMDATEFGGGGGGGFGSSDESTIIGSPGTGTFGSSDGSSAGNGSGGSSQSGGGSPDIAGVAPPPPPPIGTTPLDSSEFGGGGGGGGDFDGGWDGGGAGHQSGITSGDFDGGGGSSLWGDDPEPQGSVLPGGNADSSGTPGTSGPEIAPGGGGNIYTDITTMSDADAWATISGSTDPALFQTYLYFFPNGRFVEEATQRLAELTQQTLQPQGTAPGEGSPSVPPTIEVVRHPSLDAPEEIAAGQEFSVTVALTEDQLTPDVTVKPGPDATVTPEGALSFELPADRKEWPIDIDLLAAGFELADGGAWTRRVTLFREADSDVARFALKARAIRAPSKERQLIARLYHAGEFLGSVSRPITVFSGPPAPAPAQALAPSQDAVAAAPAQLLAAAPAAATTNSLPLATEIRIGSETEQVPDLDVTIHYLDPDELGEGLIIIHSPHIGAPVSAEFTTPEGMGEWLNSEYLRLVDLGLKLRGARSLDADAAAPQDPAVQKRFVTKVAEGFGTDLWRSYVPEAFKQVFWSLKAEGKLHSIQITSNSPVLPWELVDPQAADGTSEGFLGLNYRVARWAPRASAGQVDRPLDRIAFTGVAAVAPPYDNDRELPFQQVEVDALSKLTGFRLVDGDFNSFERLVGEVSTGFIHFSGHGEVNDPGTGSPVFAIRLLDQALDPTTWRALTFAPRDKGNPFFFFNACDTGQARSLGGFVQGWGPAILASGASGFIGGMWPLTDRTAADFSTGFYGEISGRLPSGPVYLAEVLQDVRRHFYETGDPTYLAYTFYGNANLQVVRE